MYRFAGKAALAVLAAAVIPAVPLAAQQPPTDTTAVREDTTRLYVLEPLVVEGRLDDLTGTASSASQGFVGFRDFRLRPLVREAELLETVPGVIITQHSGDGKSNQMFVRGFNLDHGTDFATRVEGMPVNIPSHAHGQGYTDLNFIIPELVDHVEYKLGTYYAEIGDFSAAGGANLRLRRSLDRPFFALGAGENGYARFVAAGSIDVGPGNLLVGGEVRRYDGPWALPQDLEKYSALARYSWSRGRHSFSLLALGYRNDWRASDQIPARLVESGVIDRFAQVDSTLGGKTSRASLSATWMRAGTTSSQRLDIYGIHYDLDLFSNFTYFLEDPDGGDQIRQRDRARKIFGANFAHAKPFGAHALTIGAQTRLDRFDVALNRTAGREVADIVREDVATQWSAGAYVEAESRWSPRLRTVLGIRGDYYGFDVESNIPENSGKASAGILSPKASVVVAANERTELYASAGLGFHSNDARGVVQAVDAATGEPVEAVHPLVRARGAELGMRLTPVRDWRTTLALWGVDLDSEMLYVGDAGTTEPSDASRRVGLTVTNYFRATPALSLDLDVSLARARFHFLPDGENRIPGAVENVIAAGVTWEPVADGPYAALRLRRLGEYPLIEDNSVRSEPTALLNLNLGWKLRGVRIGLSVMNLLDSEAADIAYFYASRLAGEPLEGVEDLHFHPVEPRQLRITASYGL